MDKMMEPEIITDAAGEPLKVVMDYKEYVNILEELKRPLPAMKITAHPIDWQTLTESVRDVFTGLVALAGREHLKELDKPHPNKSRIAELVALRDEAHNIDRNPENYSTREQMEEILSKFTPILQAEEKKTP